MGLDPTVSSEKLKEKYLELVKIYHPDKVKSTLKKAKNVREDHP